MFYEFMRSSLIILIKNEVYLMLSCVLKEIKSVMDSSTIKKLKIGK